MTMYLIHSGNPVVKTYPFHHELVGVGLREIKFKNFFDAVVAQISNKIFAASDPRLALVKHVKSMREVRGHGIHNMPPHKSAVRMSARLNLGKVDRADTFKKIRIWGGRIDPQDFAIAVHYVLTNTDLTPTDMRRALVSDVFAAMKIVRVGDGDARDNPLHERSFKVVISPPAATAP